MDESSALSRRSRGLAWTCAIAFALCLRCAEAYGVFTVNQPWARPGEHTSEAYMVLTSTEGATLIGVRSDVAARARVLRKRGGAVAVLELPAGRSVALRPGAVRIALSGLSRALKLGDRVALTLTIATPDGVHRDIAVSAEVRNESPADAERRAHRRG